MADTNNLQVPRNAAAGRDATIRGGRRGRGDHRGRGSRPRILGRGNPAITDDAAREAVKTNFGQRTNDGRGGRGKNERGSRICRPAASTRGLPYRPRRVTEMGGDMNGMLGTPSRLAIPNTFNFFEQRIGSKLSPDQMKEFLEAGCEAIANSTESRDIFMKTLATENGLTRVLQIVETDFSPSYSVSKPMFDPHCILFLRLISNEEIRHSLVLENAVGTIYNVISGPGGDRGVKFFKKVSDCLIQFKSEHDAETEIIARDKMVKIEEAFSLTAKALLSTLKLNQAAKIKTEFKVIVENISVCYRTEDINHDIASFEARTAYDNIIKIKEILSMGDAISVSIDANIRATNISRPKQPGCLPPSDDTDLPGDLSLLGPRHDNDHALISDIQILPTLSEILSEERPDFLPTRYNPNSPSKHHELGVFRLLDTQFRLLREDTAGLLRDSIRLILENWSTLVHNHDWRIKSKILRNQSPTPVRIYYGVEVQRMKSGGKKGLEIETEFDQVRGARNPDFNKRRHWWYKSRGLREGGTILALIDGEEKDDNAVVFLQVSRREVTEGQDNHTSSEVSRVNNLAGHPKRAMITLRLANPTCEDDLVYLTSKNKHLSSSSRPLILVEFPAILYNSFEGILRCLQSLHKNPVSMPFTTWLSPSVRGNTLPLDTGAAFNERRAIIPPPAYLVGNISLDLSCIPKSTSNGANVPLSISLSDDPHILSIQLSDFTTLDSGQAVAMVSALRHEIALIQGPPGTGKSYVGIQIARCLSMNRDPLGLGPILCVCYTNHALDQFLHELLDSGVTQIVRIGSHSLLSERLQALTLDHYSKKRQIPRIRGMGKRISDSQASLDNLAAAIQCLCGQLEESSVEVVKRFLEKRFPAQAKEIFRNRSEGENLSFNSKSKNESAMESWISGDAPGSLSDDNLERSIEQLLCVGIWTLKHSERALLYQYFWDTAFDELSQQLHSLMQIYSSTKQRLTALFNEPQTQFLNQFQIVGVTTTGLANNSDLLRNLRAKVLICEEAGEVLEAHVLTALLPSIQHAILIGDHLQLRPRISNLKLSMEYDHDRAGPKYNLDESLFERLANSRFELSDVNGEEREGEEKGRFPIAQLNYQRRMHPKISTLIRETLHPRLQDHPDTTLYPEVAGIKRRIFWLDHRNYEDAGDPEEPMQSKTNLWEAKMVTALVRHLCRQGRYKPGEIAVLTPYMGQLRMLKDMLEQEVDLIIGERDLEDLEASDVEVDGKDEDVRAKQSPTKQPLGKGSLLNQLRMASVDNFQGEEATVVIVSLVRSNKNQNCGFLKSPNRINVLLSRAKHGMYIIGDAKTSSKVLMWSSVIQLLEKNSNIGPKLELQCPRHPSNRIYVSSPESFVIHAPEGGCAEKCGLRLGCGHTCAVKCHSKALHDAVTCMEPCTKMRDCGHLCLKKCHENCGVCPEKLINVTLLCGHEAKEIECHRVGNLASVKCKELVKRKMTGCSHTIETKCHKSTNSIKCSNLCGYNLTCGHSCQEQCWKCTQNDSHGACNTLCGRKFTTCSHTCDQACHPNAPCSPCSRPCEVRCKHNKCPMTCSDPCPPCAEECGWSCGHRDRCNMPCAVPCDIVPCNHRCDKKLACGHRCPGVCGELCPDSKFCQICCEPEIRERTVDWIELETYGQVDIDKNPLIFLSCGHFYLTSSLDGTMELTEHYIIDPQTGKIIRPKLSQRVVMSGSAPKGCPECRMPLRNIDRYNRIVKKALLDEATRRFVAQASLKCADLVEEIQNREMHIGNERSKFLLEWPEAVSEMRDMDRVDKALREYRTEGVRLQKRINKFTKSVAKTEQPFGRVNSLFTSTVARQQNIAKNAFEYDESVIQTGFQLRAESFNLRLSWAIFWDFDIIYNNYGIDSRIRSKLSEIVATRIEDLKEKCVKLIASSRNAKFPQHEAEGLIYLAQFSTLFLSNSRAQEKSVDTATETSTRQQARESLEKCESLCSQYPGTVGYLKDDIERAKRLVNGGTFYTFVTSEEKRDVYRAMAAHFSGTGHWYYCRNNHPFTVGDCGMPMMEARCPQCGEPIGGHDHIPVQGVVRAEDLDLEFGGS